MGNILSHALADAGLISRKAVENEANREETRSMRHERKLQQKRHQETDEGRIESFSSPAQFMEYARQLLRQQGFSTHLMQRIFREAHAFADNKLVKKQRNRMHAFLCQVQEKLQGAPERQQRRMLRDGKRAFMQMNAKNL